MTENNPIDTAFNDRTADTATARLGLDVEVGFITRPEVVGRFGVVASTDAVASAIGLRVLDQGGNAFDAATAVGFALQVREPDYNGFGGELVALVRLATSGTVKVLCGQGSAPKAANIAEFRRLKYRHMPSVGLLAATVPGAFDALMLMLRDLGTMPLRAVLTPAIELARDGIPLTRAVCQKLARVQTRFRQPGWEASRDCYLPDNRVPASGAVFRNFALVAALESILVAAEQRSTDRIEQINAARDYFYRGPIARAIAQFVGSREVTDSAVTSGGLLKFDDLKNWSARWEAPVYTEYKNWTVFKAGAWSQGPVLLQQLNLLRALELNPTRIIEDSFVHGILEAAKMAYSDRDAYYGDPDFERVPLEGLLSVEYAKRRVQEMNGNAAVSITERLELDKRLTAAVEVTPDEHSPRGHEADTCHYDIIDRFGNAVSVTPSGGWFQDSPIIPELGFSLNTRAQMFNLTEGHPNCVAPGKRPRTTLSPTLAVDGQSRVLSIGTPGADYQDQYNLLVFLRIAQFGHSLQQAVEGVTFRSEHFMRSTPPNKIRHGVVTIEARFPQADRERLLLRGHIIEEKSDYGMCTCTAAMLDGELIRGAAGPTAQRGYAVGR